MKKKKRRALLIFLGSYAVSLILALVCGYFFLVYMKKEKEAAREERLRELIGLVIEETREEYDQRRRTGECSSYGIENLLRRAIREEDIYVSVYMDGQLVTHTYHMTPICLEYEGVSYNLDSTDTLKDVDDFANGVYSICKSADLANKYKYDPIGLRLFLQKDEDEINLFSVDSALINTESKTFVPGSIEVYPASEGYIIHNDGVNKTKESNLWARITLSPDGKYRKDSWERVENILDLDTGR